MLVNNQKRQEANQQSPTSGTTPPADKLQQARFT
jgi:hypothetical protein